MRPDQLPVNEQKDKILTALAASQVVVVESPTGSGKTTQLPLILHSAGYSRTGMIGVTQPRRIAAVSVCDYIARQLGTTIPGTVGYKMRFEDQTDLTTQIKIMTDGILLQEIKADRDLSRYNVIMVDEAHERSLNIDFILGLLKQVLRKRPEFKVIVSSATINAEVFSEYFDECPIVRIEAGMYPVQVLYDPPHKEDNDPEWLQFKIRDIVGRVLEQKRGGDVLIFLPGEQSIKNCMTVLDDTPFAKKLFMVPLYGRLSKEEQEGVFVRTPRGKTKIVIATNIAETSITIDGITTVIDSGLAKVNFYNPTTFTASLVEGAISKASCNQRKGRAGRTQPGYCYRLYTRTDYESRPLFSTEEIYRTDLSEVVLRMAELGISDFQSFDFISPPGRKGIAGAVQTLRLLDALTPEDTLTSIGAMMVDYPLLPRHSRMIVEAILSYPSVLKETIIAAAFLSSNTPFLLPAGEELEARQAHHAFRDDAGDFVSYLKLLEAYRGAANRQKFCELYYLDPRTMAELDNISIQLEEITGKRGIPITAGGDTREYLCAVSRGLIQFVCVNAGNGVYRSLTADKIHIHPGSVMFRETPRYIVAGEIVNTSRMFARSVSPLKQGWLDAIYPTLSEQLKPSAGGRREKERGKRDTTWEVKIGRETFELKPHKGKWKMAILPWERLSSAVREVDASALARYRGLLGRITYQGSEILSGERLTTILKISSYLDPERGALRQWPRGRNYSMPRDLGDLCAQLGSLMALCRGSKSSYGFLALYTKGNHTYWFRCAKHFETAVTASAASLEALTDELDPTTEEVLRHEVGSAYRRVSDLLEM
ncbi:MAG TPA: ATP-dependent RNA helicase, partial [Spirochaetia bacterium]|nr:ATP-dependent RNA helicase [Spirochaetia bacterium]